jgi:hypothetical protein
MKLLVVFDKWLTRVWVMDDTGRYLLLYSPEAVFKEKHGVRDPMLELTITKEVNSLYLTVNSVVSYPSPLHREWVRSLLLVEHI